MLIPTPLTRTTTLTQHSRSKQAESGDDAVVFVCVRVFLCNTIGIQNRLASLENKSGLKIQDFFFFEKE